jgi:hypothetical protein
MVYFSANSVAPASVAGGPQAYVNPYYKTQCGCGSGNSQVQLTSQGVREGFSTSVTGDHAHEIPAGAFYQAGSGSGGAPMCTLTATAPPAGCCHPAPLHCDCCNGSGYFRASEAYGS